MIGKTFIWSMILFFIAGSAWNCHVIVHDLQHPELWTDGWAHNPPVYLPILAGIFLLWILLGVHIWRVERRNSMKVDFQGKRYPVQFQEYRNGRTAIVLIGHRDDVAAIATVNVPEAPLPPDHVLIKDYSENDGMLAALERAGIVRATGEFVESGHALIPICEVLVEVPAKQASVEPKRAGPAKSAMKDMDRG